MPEDSFVRVVFRIKKLWTFDPTAAVLCIQPVTDEGNVIEDETLYTSFMGANMWFMEVGLPTNTDHRYRLSVVNPKAKTLLEQEDFVRRLHTNESPLLVDLVFNIPGDKTATMMSSLTPSGDAVNVSVHIPMMKIENGRVIPLEMLGPMAEYDTRLTKAVGHSEMNIIEEEDLGMPFISKNCLHGRYPGLYILNSGEEVTGPLIEPDLLKFCPRKDNNLKFYAGKRFLRCLAYVAILIVTVTVISLCVWIANKFKDS